MNIPAAGTMSPLGLAARWFPLVPRPKPPCPPLAERIDRVSRLVEKARHGTGDALTHAAEACNLAALIASDSAMPDLARELCWQQFNAFATAGPYDKATAKLALQPLINLARLRIRDGDSDSGYRMIESLYAGVLSARTHATIDDHAVNLTELVVTGDDHKAIVQWLWTVLLSDGLRALCRSGNWAGALHQAGQHNGIGQRLLDGRQVAILASIASGHHNEAEELLQATTPAEPWEHVVAGCLQVINRPVGQVRTPGADAQRMTSSYLAIEAQGRPMFVTRLGLAVAELSESPGDQCAAMSRIERIATQTTDAYIAREVLTSPVVPLIAAEARDTLRKTLHRAGLGTPLNAAQQQQLLSSCASAATTISVLLVPIRLSATG